MECLSLPPRQRRHFRKHRKRTARPLQDPVARTTPFVHDGAVTVLYREQLAREPYSRVTTPPVQSLSCDILTGFLPLQPKPYTSSTPWGAALAAYRLGAERLALAPYASSQPVQAGPLNRVVSGTVSGLRPGQRQPSPWLCPGSSRWLMASRRLQLAAVGRTETNGYADARRRAGSYCRRALLAPPLVAHVVHAATYMVGKGLAGAVLMLDRLHLSTAPSPANAALSSLCRQRHRAGKTMRSPSRSWLIV